ncbi:putative ATP-dependent RNA helicase DDX10 [Stigmatopora argus]
MAEKSDPVKEFEKWKKRYNLKKARVKRERGVNKPVWQVERENIERLVSRYDDIKSEEVVRFSDFPLSKKTLLGLQYCQYRQPTEIQKQTIGVALRGKDVLGAAKTGSGKTLAFLIPLLEILYRQQWSSADGLGALIISPTRELAYQTFELLRKVGRKHDFSAGLVIGGKELKNESALIHRTNVVVCTPGRLLQHMDETAHFHASDLQLLVLDEADRILDMGFAPTLDAILENLPAGRQTLLFSATQTKSIKDLARLSLKDPEYVWVHEKARFSTPATLEQSYVVCPLQQKVDMLFSFIRSHIKKKILVFFACCKEVQFLFRIFCRLRPGLPVLALHGKQHQMKRVEVYEDFLRKRCGALFATDVAARGLDFPAVNWVLQYDCPEDADTYIHRVGRAARYKENGEALLLLLPSEEEGMVARLKDKKVPVRKIQVNSEKLQNVQQKLESFLAQEQEQKERAQRCFVSYLRSVHLMKNKDVFDVSKLPLRQYARSLGLAAPPRVRFLNRAEAAPEKTAAEEAGGSHDDDDDDDDDNDDDDGGPSGAFAADDDQEDLDFLTLKRKDVFAVEKPAETQAEEGPATEVGKKKEKKVSRFAEAKKIIRRNLKVNTKTTFTDDGDAVQVWPPTQRLATDVGDHDDDEEDREASGIDVDKAKERMKKEDQEFDKPEYTRKVKAKHREKRLKAKAERREASKRNRGDNEEEEDEEDEEGEEVVAYLADGGHEEFDPDTLPDPDRCRRERGGAEDEEEDEDEEEEEPPPKKKKKKARWQEEEEEEEEPAGLSLAEDEELALRLLSGRPF